ncbi:Na+/H+ antiporter NhaC family protein [Brevibacillus invocatus]|uniref:Na+/H+ antiporter NhaC family protein n=1 Tax=Brevibacillus invocatus TaxID=173959 RepID=UPI00204200ED|nr:Na+/H+ antiporter NhaC family protein [Brevibacillus invocatus]MCM3078508.1 sodium:proton antiporter [Brevibacillus invocatus]MCM3430914.1 sodium:proton antiporter [Brevibacillus invocatus]
MNSAAVFPISSLIVGIVLSLTLGFPLSWGILFAILVTLVSVKKLGFSWGQQFSFGWDGIRQTKPVLIILFLVGLLIPLLMMGGTIPAIIYYGLSIVNVEYLLVLSFILTSVVSYLLGTSVGTLSTIGLSLMGIAHAADLSAGMVGGALICGAMVGERFSPISSSRMLVLSHVGMTEKQDRATQGAARLTTIICAVLFLVLDLFREQAGSGDSIRMYQELLTSHFSISWGALIPLFVLIAVFAFRVKAIYALLCGVVASLVLVLSGGPITLSTLAGTILYGYEPQTGTLLDELVHGGGMISILSVLLLIVLAGFLNGILNKANLLTPFVERMMGVTKNKIALVGKSMAISLLVVMISCNQTIPILVMGSTLIGRFSQFTRGKEFLGKTMLDSTLVMPVLIPWNGLAMVIAISLGVSTIETLPFLFYSLLLPIVTLISSRRFGEKEAGMIPNTKKAM